MDRKLTRLHIVLKSILLSYHICDLKCLRNTYSNELLLLLKPLKVGFTRATTTRLPLKSRLNWPSSGRQFTVIQRQSADPARAVSSASGKRQSMTKQIRVCCSIEFALDSNKGSENSSEVNKIAALIGHCACATWENSACSSGSQRHCAAGLADWQHRQRCRSCKHPCGTALCVVYHYRCRTAPV